MEQIPDPFRESRQKDGVLQCPFHGENIVMLLKHEDVRNGAKDWKRFSSDAPFRVPIPSEEEVRSMRQLPIETDPPEHTEYRKITESFFLQPKTAPFIATIEQLIGSALDQVFARESFEAVNDFALPLQSRALTHLLRVPESEADIWIGWGIHVFKVTGGAFKKGTVLEDYLHSKFDEAERNPSGDIFSALSQATFQGRKLARDEMMGYANLAFAGGRDTIIHSITCVLAYLGENPDAFEFLREDPDRIVHASEEFFRIFMPLTLIGRVCAENTEVHGVQIKKGERIGLCWASANFDEEAFENPSEVRLARKPNPHVSFGFGHHLCSGAAHARLVLRTLLRFCCERVAKIRVIEKVERVEREATFERQLGYDRLVLSLERLVK